MCMSLHIKKGGSSTNRVTACQYGEPAETNYHPDREQGESVILTASKASGKDLEIPPLPLRVRVGMALGPSFVLISTSLVRVVLAKN